MKRITVILSVLFFSTMMVFSSIKPAIASAIPISPTQLSTLSVENFSGSTTEAQLQELFSQYGEVKYVHIFVDPQTGRQRPFAFVEMLEADDEDTAIDSLDGETLGDRPLRVSKARARREGISGGRTSRRSRY